MSAEIKPYRIDIPLSQLDDLHDRLDRTRWPDELPDVGWGRGVPVGYLKDLAAYWRNAYDWRKHEERLNAFPQFTTEVDGQTVHFLHIRSAHSSAVPLIVTHGWPGSFVEFLDVIGPLTDPGSHGADGSDAFHVVVPSIPGFGFSAPTQQVGWNVHRIAAPWQELMSRLGYERYGAQRGDWGSLISRELGRTLRQHRALVGVRAGRTLRRNGGSRHVCRGHWRVLPQVSLSKPTSQRR